MQSGLQNSLRNLLGEKINPEREYYPTETEVTLSLPFICTCCFISLPLSTHVSKRFH